MPRRGGTERLVSLPVAREARLRVPDQPIFTQYIYIYIYISDAIKPYYQSIGIVSVRNFIIIEYQYQLEMLEYQFDVRSSIASLIYIYIYNYIYIYIYIYIYCYGYILSIYVHIKFNMYIY